MNPLVENPPLDPLRRLIDRLARAEIESALGGSALLASLGRADRIGDWDLQTDAEPDRVARALADLRPEHAGNDALHADEKWMITGDRIEVIVRMAYFAPEGIVRIPADVSGTWQGLPMASPEAWAVAYSMLGRAEKAGRLFAELEKRGADAHRLAKMLAQPLPGAIAGRLRALPLATQAPARGPVPPSSNP